MAHPFPLDMGASSHGERSDMTTGASTPCERVKGPCLVLVIEWKLRWINYVLCEIHRWLSTGTCVWATYAMEMEMAWRCCKACTCDDGGAYCMWDMTLSHVIKVEKIKTWLGLIDRLQVWRASWRLWSEGPRTTVKLEQDLAPMDQRNGEEQVRSRSMN
jgi:hypothetical protein